MAYNKNNYDKQRLTPKQEEFCQQIMQGKSQYESYLTAYPASRKWTRNTVDVAASQLMDDNKIIIRLKEMGYKDTKKVEWTRQKALETINYVMDMNKKEMERLDEAYQTEIDLLEEKLRELSGLASAMKTPQDLYNLGKQMQDITAQIAKCKKQRRTYATNIHGVFEGAKILNRMFGYDIQKVEVKQVDEDREELNKLNADELKAVLAMNKDG